MNSVDSIKDDAGTRMRKSLEALKQELAKLRTGRAHTSLLDHIHVAYYGTEMPLNQVASISIADPRTLSVTPWEKRMVPEVEKAIMNSELGLNPVSAGEVIRVPLPPLTEERRKDIVKQARNVAEQARVAVRNIRRDLNENIKQQKKEGLSEDAAKRDSDQVQTLTDERIAEINGLLTTKEKEIMEL